MHKTPWSFDSSQPRSLSRKPSRAREGRPCSGDGGHRRRGPKAGKGSGTHGGLLALLVEDWDGQRERDLDESPRRRWKGHRRRQCSGGERRQQTCARASVRHGERVRATN
jgi:hypothetical protein